MSESNGNGRILSLDASAAENITEAAAKDPDLKMSRREMRAPISRAECVQFITTAALALGEKIYKEISEEHARVFAEMEKRLSDQIAVLRGEIESLRSDTHG